MGNLPQTLHGLDPFVCISTLQKAIRRAQERSAMEMASELINTSKAFCTMATNRLEIISHEDIDNLSQPWTAPFVATACQQARDGYAPKRLGKSRLPVCNPIIMP